MKSRCRTEALKYYRRVADHYRLDIRQYQRVEQITGEDGAFVTHAIDMHGCPLQYESKKVDSFDGLLRCSQSR